MQFFKLTIEEIILLSMWPIIYFTMAAINYGFIFDKFLFLVGVTTSFLLYRVIRWAFFKYPRKLGISSEEYWAKREKEDGASWTHGG